MIGTIIKWYKAAWFSNLGAEIVLVENFTLHRNITLLTTGWTRENGLSGVMSSAIYWAKFQWNNHDIY